MSSTCRHGLSFARSRLSWWSPFRAAAIVWERDYASGSRARFYGNYSRWTLTKLAASKARPPMHQCASWLKMKVCKLYIASTYSFSKRKAMCCTVLITSWRGSGYKLFYAYLCTCSHKTLLRACYFRGKKEVINYKSWTEAVYRALLALFATPTSSSYLLYADNKLAKL